MSRIHTNKVVLLIAGLLLAAALAFAWLRSQSAATQNGAPAPQRMTEAVGATEFDRVLGAQMYEAHCASCHAQGEGSRRLPPLRRHAVDLFQAENGRAYLIDFLLYGLERHPAYADRLSDDEAAAVLNHMLTAWGNAELLETDRRLYSPPEVAGHRLRPLTPAQVQMRRPQPPGSAER